MAAGGTRGGGWRAPPATCGVLMSCPSLRARFSEKPGPLCSEQRHFERNEEDDDEDGTRRARTRRRARTSNHRTSTNKQADKNEEEQQDEAERRRGERELHIAGDASQPKRVPHLMQCPCSTHSALPCPGPAGGGSGGGGGAAGAAASGKRSCCPPPG